MQLIPRPEEGGLHNIAAVLFKQPQRTIKLPVPPSRHPFQVRASTIACASVVLPSSEIRTGLCTLLMPGAPFFHACALSCCSA